VAVLDGLRTQLAVRLEVLLPHLNERQRRLLLGVEARLLGHGGIRAVAQAAGVSETTVRRGVSELEAGVDPLPVGRARRTGGGRSRAEQLDPALVPALLALVEPDERGDPCSPLRWTTKSLRNLAAELGRQGRTVSAMTVGRLLKANGFSLQSAAKTLEGDQHPDRDAQFRYLNDQVKDHQAAGQPVVSVDAKKKEQVGLLPMAGREWRPCGQPIQVEDHSFFAGPRGDTVIPYGIYDMTANTGWVNVGLDHDTAAFAVASIRAWWYARGRLDYPQATRLLITADAGGSNSYRYRLWKAELAAFAAEAGLTVTVCNFPPGTSKWNKIEHPINDVLPILDDRRITITPSEHRHTTATDLLASVEQPSARTGGRETGRLFLDGSGWMTQVWTTASGHAFSTTSGSPFSPSHTTKNASRTPRFFRSTSTLIPNLAPSPPTPVGGGAGLSRSGSGTTSEA
jgi:transposase